MADMGLPDDKSIFVRQYDSLFGKWTVKVHTTVPKPEGADLMGYCSVCQKWTWLVGAFCSECGTKNFFG